MKIAVSGPHHESLLVLSHIHPKKKFHCHTHLAVEYYKYHVYTNNHRGYMIVVVCDIICNVIRLSFHTYLVAQ